MKPKKNSNADVTKNSFLFFQIGLILVLFGAWKAIEMKTYATNNSSQTFFVKENFLVETNPPIIPQSKPKLPEKIKIEKVPVIKYPVVFDVIDNSSKDEPAIVDFTKPTKPTAKINDIPTIDHAEPIENIPYIIVESVPVFPGCEGLSDNTEKQKCMESKIKKIVHKNFDKELAQDLGLEGINRIQVLFKIDYLGNVVDVEAITAHPELKKEALRIVYLFPKMKPGKQQGVPVNVSYSFPIIFQVQ